MIMFIAVNVSLIIVMKGGHTSYFLKVVKSPYDNIIFTDNNKIVILKFFNKKGVHFCIGRMASFPSCELGA